MCLLLGGSRGPRIQPDVHANLWKIGDFDKRNQPTLPCLQHFRAADISLNLVPEISAAQDDRSVQSRRSMSQIARANDKQWQSNRARSLGDVDLRGEARSKRLSGASAG